MRLAIFGDIHGNIEALRAAYRAVEMKADKIFHLGDLGVIHLMEQGLPAYFAEKLRQGR